MQLGTDVGPVGARGGRLAPRRGFQLAAMSDRRKAATLGPVTLRCVIVDDNASFLKAASTLLERQGLVVAGTVGTAAGALQQTRELRPDVNVKRAFAGLPEDA